MVRYATYPLALLTWLLYLFLFPTWIGKSYNPDVLQPAKYDVGGTFGLQEDASTRPLWNPPQPYSDSIAATFRYPWQAVNQHHYIEIDTNKLVCDFTLGTMTLGFLVGLWQLISRRYQSQELVGIPPILWKRFLVYLLIWTLLVGVVLPNIAQLFIPYGALAVISVLFCVTMGIGLPRVVVSVAWGISIALAIAWTVLMVLAMFSMGYIFSAEGLVFAIQIGGMAAGGVLGYYLHHRWVAGK